MNALERLGRKSIRVTDLASQYWCEKQMELRYLYGEKMNEQVKKGKLIHEALETETNIPILLEPKNYSDYVYKILYTDYSALTELRASRKTREFQLFGSLEGFNIGGKVDELEVKEDGLTILEDKTRAKDDVPNESQILPNKIQIMFYKKILEDLKNGSYTAEIFGRFYGTSRLSISPEFDRQLAALKVPQEQRNIKKMESLVFSSLKELPKISDTLYIRYRNQFTGKIIKLYKFYYNEEELKNAMQYLFGYWKGSREAMPVPEQEAWKCNYCVFFGNHCKVWWKQKELNVK